VARILADAAAEFNNRMGLAAGLAPRFRVIAFSV